MSELNKIRIFEIVRFVRKSKQIKSEILARNLKISQGFYSKMENGKINKWSDYIAPICNILKIDYEELIFLSSLNSFDLNEINKSLLSNSSNESVDLIELYNKLEFYKEEIKKLEYLINNINNLKGFNV